MESVSCNINRANQNPAEVIREASSCVNGLPHSALLCKRMYLMSSNGSSFNGTLVWKRDDHASFSGFCRDPACGVKHLWPVTFNSCLNIDAISTFMIVSVSNKVPEQFYLLSLFFLLTCRCVPKRTNTSVLPERG